MNRSQALLLLSECTGDDIWSIDYCRKRQVPDLWIRQMRDAYESNFAVDDQTIYYGDRPVNQFEGVRDVDLACKIAQSLGLDIRRITSSQVSRSGMVRAIREALEEE